MITPRGNSLRVRRISRSNVEQLLHGPESRDMCDDIAKKPAKFDIAHTLEATRLTANEIKIATSIPETTHKLGYSQPKKKNNGKQWRQRSLSRGRQQQQHKQKNLVQKKQDRPCQECGKGQSSKPIPVPRRRIS